MSEPRFRDPIWSPQTPLPYVFQDVTVLCYWLMSDMKSLRKLCTDMLGSPDGESTYEPLAPWVLLELLSYPRMVVAKEPWKSMGFTSQLECAYAVPVIRRKHGKLVDFAYFVPFVFVTDPLSVICGRDVLGYPKYLGRFKCPRGFGNNPMSVETMVYARKGQKTTWQEVTKVDGAPAPPSPPIEPPKLHPFLGPMMHVFGPDGSSPLSKAEFKFLQDLPEMSYGCVQLREFRDMQETDLACYQAVLRTTVTIKKIHSRGLLAPSRVVLPKYFSMDIAKVLGIRMEFGSAMGWSPFYQQCTFDMKDPVNIWEDGSFRSSSQSSARTSTRSSKTSSSKSRKSKKTSTPEVPLPPSPPDPPELPSPPKPPLP